MIEFLNSAAFHIAGSPASWAELIGAALGIAMVICNMRQIHWGWPLAFASALLYFIVFADAKLYAEAALQIFFALTAIWGWLQWLRGVQPDGQALKVRRIEKLEAIKLGVISALFFLAIGLFLTKFTPSDVPWFDALPTVLSLAATYLLGKKYIENWPLWIVVNIISIALFAYKGLWLTVGLYAVFAIMAALGWQAWARALKANT
jgi:nicotinamide mononucleotide transporter